MKLWYTNNSPFTSYTTVTPHSDSRSDFSTYVTSHVQYTTYKIIVYIERATVLRADITSVMHASIKQAHHRPKHELNITLAISEGRVPSAV